MVMKVSTMLSFIFLFILIQSACSGLIPDSFIHCLSDNKFLSNISILSALYANNNSSYESILESPISNLRFLTSTTLKPVAIITPLVYSHVQATVTCCKQNGLQIRIRSGGHDFEGMSYRSQVPFVILDLRFLRSIRIDIKDNSAWVESGTTIGELYYSIAERSPIHGFPAGVVPDVGIGGHISGGGIGYLVRKYGLAADNVIDAIVVDANGRILDKKMMGSDLFWAIRGGGGASFGVIVAWKIKLIHVPPVVTVFKLTKSLKEGAIDLVHKWQHVAPKLKEDLTIGVILQRLGGTSTFQASFSSLFLGRANQLLNVMEERIPEFQLRKEDCIEMSWIESVLYLSEIPGKQAIEVLKNRTFHPLTSYLKIKSDLVHYPLPYEALQEVWKWGSEVEFPTIQIHPYGGIMDRISESEIPFPHRKGVLFEILYFVQWRGDKDGESSERNINKLRWLYEFMTPYVSSRPRGAYLNAIDLDLGTNNMFGSGTAYCKAKAWGLKYFRSNFKRLAIVKGRVDPGNFFYFEQSIPPLVSQERGKCKREPDFN